MSTTIDLPGVDIPADLLDLLRKTASDEVEMAADNLCTGTDHVAEMYRGDHAALTRMFRMEEAILAYRHVWSTAPYDLATVLDLATLCIEHQAGDTDNTWPRTADDGDGLMQHLELIRLRDEWTMLADRDA